MKRIIFTAAGAILMFVLGVAIMVPVNIWYADTYLGGEDCAGNLWRLNTYMLWPIFLIVGAFLSNLAYKKFLTKNSSGC